MDFMVGVSASNDEVGSCTVGEVVLDVDSVLDLA